MPQILEGDLLARDHKVALVVSRFNEFITKELQSSAEETYRRLGGNVENLTVALVPGSLEIPIAAQRLVKTGRFAAVICLGCVIRGATGHYEQVAGQCAAGVAKLNLDSGVPVIFGVITAESLEQAIERAGSKQGNTGGKAMLAALEMANLFRAIEGGK